MSQHPSFKAGQATAEQRSVLKRFEKVKFLQEKKLWTEGTSIFHLPKVKTVRLKVKKAAAEAPKETAQTSVAAPTATAETAKPTSTGKETTKK